MECIARALWSRPGAKPAGATAEVEWALTLVSGAGRLAPADNGKCFGASA